MIYEARTLEEKTALGIAIHAGSGHRRWTDRELHWALSLAADETGRVTVHRYLKIYNRRKNTRKPVPSHVTFEMRYGSWNKAVEANGFTHGNSNRIYIRMSMSELAEAVGFVINALDGELPSVAAYDDYRAEYPALGLPCCAIIRRRFGTWPAALKAGLEYNNGL